MIRDWTLHGTTGMAVASDTDTNTGHGASSSSTARVWRPTNRWVHTPKEEDNTGWFCSVQFFCELIYFCTLLPEGDNTIHVYRVSSFQCWYIRVYIEINHICLHIFSAEQIVFEANELYTNSEFCPSSAWMSDFGDPNFIRLFCVSVNCFPSDLKFWILHSICSEPPLLENCRDRPCFVHPVEKIICESAVFHFDMSLGHLSQSSPLALRHFV